MLLACLHVLALLLAVPALNATPASAAGLDLTLSMSPAKVRVSAVDSGPLATLSGIAIVDQTQLMRTVVELAVLCGWVCQVDPSVLYFDGNYPQAFKVTVNIPFGTLPTETMDVVVSGICKVGGVPVSNATATATISIQEYSVFELDFDVSQGYLVQGEDRVMRLLVHNRANVPLRFGLSVKDAPHGATVILPTVVPEVGPNEFVNYTFELQTDTEIATAYQGITFSVKATEVTGADVQTREFIVPLDIESRTENVVRGSLPMLMAVAIAGVCAAIYLMRRRRRSRRVDAESVG